MGGDDRASSQGRAHTHLHTTPPNVYLNSNHQCATHCTAVSVCGHVLCGHYRRALLHWAYMPQLLFFPPFPLSLYIQTLFTETSQKEATQQKTGIVHFGRMEMREEEEDGGNTPPTTFACCLQHLLKERDRQAWRAGVFGFLCGGPLCLPLQDRRPPPPSQLLSPPHDRLHTRRAHLSLKTWVFADLFLPSTCA